MIDATVTFVLWNLPTLLIPPDSLNDKWDKYAHPGKDDKGVFHFHDADGDIELVINHESSVTITVSGTISEEVIKKPNTQDRDH